MGMSISGGMIVGCYMSDLPEEVFVDYEDSCDWAESNDLDYFSPWYDAESSEWFVGYRINSVEIEDEFIFMDWVTSVSEKAENFKNLTGVTATLKGMQNIW